MRPLILLVPGLMALGLAALPLPAAAIEALCTFHTECYESQPCEASAFEIAITPGDTAATVRLGSDAEGAMGQIMTTRQNREVVIVSDTPASFRLLTLGQKYARYSVHLAGGPLVVTYLGTCVVE